MGGVLVGFLGATALVLLVMFAVEFMGQIVAPHDKCDSGEVALVVWGKGYVCVKGHVIKP